MKAKHRCDPACKWVFLIAIMVIAPALAHSVVVGPVRGEYDSVNDWFVFEYFDPRLGQNARVIYDPPHKVEPTVWGKASKIDAEEFAYSYRIANGPGAIQRLDDFILRLDVPVTSPTAPPDWRAALHRIRKLDWYWTTFMIDPPGLAPGTEESGFGIQASGLPDVVRCDFVGVEREEFDPPGDMSTEEIITSFGEVSNALDAQFPDKIADSVVRECVGPKLPASPFDPTQFTNHLLDLKNQSLTLGWIKDEAASQELGSRLSAISTQLAAIQDQKISVTTGRTVLELAAQFMQYVESNSCKEFECAVPEGQSPKPLTSEAYALLYFNMDYFATQVAKACNLPAPQVSPSPKRKSKAAGKK